MLQEPAFFGPSMVLWDAIDVGSTPLVSSLELTQNCTRRGKIFIIVTESIVDDKPEMSQDELQFMQNAEETVKLKDGHSQISLPFKDREASVPNNKSQALQRANWLKKELERDKRLPEDYKTFMVDIVAKG